MDIKKRVSSVHQKIKDLGYIDFKRTHAQEVLATSLGFRNFHSMKSHYEGNSLQDALDVLLKREKTFLVPVGCSTIADEFAKYEFISIKISEQDINKIVSLINSPIFDDEKINSINFNAQSMSFFIVENIERDEDDDEIILKYTTRTFDSESTSLTFKINKKEITIIIELSDKYEVISLYGSISINELETVQWEVISGK